jgi:hypothetical protein
MDDDYEPEFEEQEIKHGLLKGIGTILYLCSCCGLSFQDAW